MYCKLYCKVKYWGGVRFCLFSGGLKVQGDDLKKQVPELRGGPSYVYSVRKRASEDFFISQKARPQARRAEIRRLPSTDASEASIRGPLFHDLQDFFPMRSLRSQKLFPSTQKSKFLPL